MKALIAAVLATMLIAVVGFFAHAHIRSMQIPKPVHQPFSELDGAWMTPPLPAAEYDVWVEFKKNEPERLESLKLTITDQTTGEALHLQGLESLIKGSRNYDQWEGVFAGRFHADEGHRYDIRVDPAQVERLAKWQHRLTIDLTAAERNNRAMKAMLEW